MPKRVLHKKDASPPSSAVMMTAYILNLELEYKEPALLENEHKTPEFRQMNPMGVIPVLQDGNFTVSESHAIMKYLLEKYGGNHRSTLYPADLQQRAVVDERMYFDAGVFFVKLKAVAWRTFLQGLQGPTPEHLADIEDAYHTIELYLQKTRYIAADHLTIADLSVGSTAFAIKVMLPLNSEKFPKTTEWLQRLEEEPCFQKVGLQCAAEFRQLMKIFWEKNKAEQ